MEDDHRRNITPEVRRIQVCLEGIITRFSVADMNLALVDTLMQSNVAEQLNNSTAAHAYNRLVHTIYLDVLKDLWAITLDTNRNSASLKQLKRLVTKGKMRQALKELYVRPLPIEHVGEGQPDLEARQRVHELHRREYGEQFDEIYPRLLAGIEEVLTNGRLDSLQDARHQFIAHSSIADTPGKGPELVNIDRFKLHWQAAEAVFEELDPVVTDAALIFTGRNHGKSVRYREQHRQWAADFWERLRKLG